MLLRSCKLVAEVNAPARIALPLSVTREAERSPPTTAPRSCGEAVRRPLMEVASEERSRSPARPCGFIWPDFLPARCDRHPCPAVDLLVPRAPSLRGHQRPRAVHMAHETGADPLVAQGHGDARADGALVGPRARACRRRQGALPEAWALCSLIRSIVNARWAEADSDQAPGSSHRSTRARSRQAAPLA